MSRVYLLIRTLVARTIGTGRRGRDDGAKDLEILVLRHQLRVLQRMAGRPQLRPIDRVLLAAASRVLPRDRWVAFLVTPAPALAAAALDYVEVFENPSYGGASMYMAQDYSVLSLIGWNDRISSFKGLNGQAGIFYTDWLYGGSTWSFCCNQNISSLGAFNDTFSSVRHS